MSEDKDVDIEQEDSEGMWPDRRRKVVSVRLTPAQDKTIVIFEADDDKDDFDEVGITETNCLLLLREGQVRFAFNPLAWSSYEVLYEGDDE